MQLVYLGTAAAEGIPGLFCKCRFCENARKSGGKEIRLRSGAVIDGRLMIDFSPDIYISSQRAGISLAEIGDIVFTHSHPDHCNAYDLRNRGRGYCYFNGQEEKLHTYGNEAVGDKITLALKGNFERYGVDFTFIKPFVQYSIGGYTVTPLTVAHADENAYIYLIEDGKKRMLYGNDTGIFPDETFEYLKGKYCNLVSLDCTMGYQDKECGHMGFSANLKVKQKLLDNKTADEKTVFVCHHFSHNGLCAPDVDLTYDRFSQMVNPHGFVISYDGMKIEF